jgi:hypothetical protein
MAMVIGWTYIFPPAYMYTYAEKLMADYSLTSAVLGLMRSKRPPLYPLADDQRFTPSRDCALIESQLTPRSIE